VLKDEDVVSSCGVKENDFLVVMLTKAKKASPAPAAAAAAPAAAQPPATPAPAPAESTKTPAPAPAAPAPTPAAPTRDDISDEVVNNLTAMGFPEAEVRHCLRAAHGNPDVAVEFLTNGIPDGVAQAAAAMNIPSASPSAPGSGQQQPLQALRNHPQFDDLRRLVQSNPQMLQQVLTQIGQQQPELLQEINANQALFLQMMNEPVDSSSGSGTSAPAPMGTSSMPRGDSGTGDAGGLQGMEGMGSPAQMAQMIQNMSPEEVNQMAAMMGLTPEQLRATVQMLGQMPPEQLNQFMMQAMGGGEGMAGMMGGGPQVLRLTEEEMAAVNRLTEMGFDRSEAAQAFLACDKNEALAANLLMDSMGDGGGGGEFGFGNGAGDGSGNDDGNNNDDNNDGDGGGDNNNDDGDDMYD